VLPSRNGRLNPYTTLPGNGGSSCSTRSSGSPMCPRPTRPGRSPRDAAHAGPELDLLVVRGNQTRTAPPQGLPVRSADLAVHGSTAPSFSLSRSSFLNPPAWPRHLMCVGPALRRPDGEWR
jgi:hypothetical protein